MFLSKKTLTFGLSSILIGYLLGSEIEKKTVSNNFYTVIERINAVEDKLSSLSTISETKQNNLLQAVSKLNKQIQDINLKSINFTKSVQPRIDNAVIQNTKTELTDLNPLRQNSCRLKF